MSAVGALSVVLPALNEADNLPGVVGAALAALDRLGLPGEVVVVDDGSVDRTAPVVGALAAGDARVRLVRHPVNRGYGAALATGIAAARGTHLLLTDADRQFDPGGVDRLLPWARRFPLVVGYRAPRRDGWARRALGRTWTGLANRLLDLGVRDVDCAFKLVRRDVFEAVRLTSRGAAVSAELLARARAAGFAVAEVPVEHHPRPSGRPTGARPSVMGRAGLELYGLRRELRGAATRARSGG